MAHYRFLNASDDPISNTHIEQITILYRQAGWWEKRDDDPALVRCIIDGSHFFLVATENDNIIGMGRAISDRASDAYIQDVTVLSSHRKKGLGSQIVSHLVNRLEAAGLMWIGLIAEKKTNRFYERIGFQQMEDATPMKLIKRP